MNNTPYLVETKDVVKDYAQHRALDHVSVAIPRGQIFGLLGPNGAGKTTLIRILNRITAPDKGEVLFEGRPFLETDLCQIGYLPEERGLYRKMKVAEQAIYLAQLKGLTKKTATQKLREWFERFGISDWWNKKVEELSKGMAQKVQFIITVIHEPKLLIFDEPFSGFDPVNADLLKNEMVRLKEQGHTIIFSTHNMQSVEQMCDNIALINNSKVILQGNITEIQNQYRGSKYLVQFSSPVQYQNWDMLPTTHADVNLLGQQTLTLNNTQHMSNNEIVKFLLTQGDILKFEELLPSMHDIFVNTVTASSPNLN